MFPVPSVCQFLTKESKTYVIEKTKCNDQGSKVDDFFRQTQWLFEEMQCQKELRGNVQGLFVIVIIIVVSIIIIDVLYVVISVFLFLLFISSLE